MTTYQTPAVVQLASSGHTLLATLADPDNPHAPHGTADYVDMGGWTETGPVKDPDGTVVAYEYAHHGLTLPAGVRSSLLLHLGTADAADFATARGAGMIELGRFPIDPQQLETSRVVRDNLTTPDVSAIADALVGGTYTIHRGDTVTLAFSGLGDISDRDTLWFTGKYRRSDADAAAAFQASEAGLLTVAGRDPKAADGESATLTITDAAAGDGQLVLSAAATAALLPASKADWGIKVLRTDGTLETLAENDRDADPAEYLKITLEVTRRTAA